MRRLLSFLLIALVLFAGGANAQRVRNAQDYVPPNNTFRNVHIRLCEGQSWSTNFFTGMHFHNFNPQTGILLQMGVASGGFPTGIMAANAGISLNAPLAKITTIHSTDAYPVVGFPADTGDGLTACRAGVLAQNWLRLAGGKPLVPILEANFGYPSSAWFAIGPGGSLQILPITYTGSIASGTPPILTVSGVARNTLVAGMYVVDAGGSGVAANTNILAFGTSGTTGTGGNGTYALNLNQTVSSRAMYSVSAAGFAFGKWAPRVSAVLPDAAQHLNFPLDADVSWIQGGSLADAVTPAATVAEWTAMEADNDALPYPWASGMKYYVAIRTGITSAVALVGTEVGAWQFVRANANGRTIGTCPMYFWQFLGTDNIHLGDIGTIRLGECQGYAAYVTMDEGTPYTPFWRSLTRPTVVSGNIIRLPFDRPKGLAFQNAVPAFFSDPNSGVKVWPQFGFHVRRVNVEQPFCADPAIDGLDVVLTLCGAAASGDEVTYAFYGPGGPEPGTESGVGGNYAIAGPLSVLFANDNNPFITMPAWPWQEFLP